jgi:hypothetical protein
LTNNGLNINSALTYFKPHVINRTFKSTIITFN